MTEKGIVICRPEGDTTLNGLEYLFEEERNEIRHFETKKDAEDFLEEHGIDEEDIILKYHIFCQQCGKEFFFDTEEMPDEEDTVLYLCPNCRKVVEDKMNSNN